MKPIFRVELWKESHPGGDAYAELVLPATPYELLDALERFGLEEGEAARWEVVTYFEFYHLNPFLSGTGSIHELNVLAQKLSEMDSTQSTAFVGLLNMRGPDNPVTMPYLLDAAFGTDCCHVVENVWDDEQLGEFYVKNGFIPETENFTETQLAMLDYEKIGRERREAERGAFTKDGYVMRHSELAEVHKSLDLTPKQPDYTILLEASRGFFNDPEYDSGKVVQLKLPATLEELDAVLERLEAWDWREVGWHCEDCRVPMLADAVSDEEEITSINHLAQRLAELAPEALSAYKALLEAANCNRLDSAEQLLDTLDDYTLHPQIRSPEAAAREKLQTLMGNQAAELLVPHVNLHLYGWALIQAQGSTLTSHGLIKRKDGQPVQAMEAQPKSHEMEMMQC